MTEGLTITGLTVGYGRRPVLTGIDLPPLQPGEITVFAGPNAAGKSTLLRAIARLIPSTGRITLDGTDLATLPAAERARRVGFMPQMLPTTSRLSVLEGVIAALRATGEMPAAEAERRAHDALTRLGIAPLGMRGIATLSGGQRQMVSLAQAIVRDPRLLLLDEPTSALDLARQLRLLTELRRLADEGRIVVVVLHDLSMAAQWADRIVLLHDGRVDGVGLPADLLTPAMLARVYGVEGRVERSSRGQLMILTDKWIEDGAGAA